MIAVQSHPYSIVYICKTIILAWLFFLFHWECRGLLYQQIPNSGSLVFVPPLTLEPFESLPVSHLLHIAARIFDMHRNLSVGVIFSPTFERWRNHVDLSTWHTSRQMREPTETQGAPSYKASAEKHRSSIRDWGSAGSVWGAGKQAFESQDLCNGSNPCSEMLEMRLLISVWKYWFKA